MNATDCKAIHQNSSDLNPHRTAKRICWILSCNALGFQQILIKAILSSPKTLFIV